MIPTQVLHQAEDDKVAKALESKNEKYIYTKGFAINPEPAYPSGSFSCNYTHFALSKWQQSPDPSTLPTPRWYIDSEKEEKNK